MLVIQLALASSHCILLLAVIQQNMGFYSHSTHKKPCKETPFGREAAYEMAHLSKLPCSHFGGLKLISRAVNGAKAPQCWSCWTERNCTSSPARRCSLPALLPQKQSSSFTDEPSSRGRFFQLPAPRSSSPHSIHQP